MRASPIPVVAIVAGGLTAILLFHPGTAKADDIRVAQLEQDVRELRRDMQQQTRRIDSLESASLLSRPGRARVEVVTPADQSAPKSAAARTLWLQGANWEKVQAGMGELDVIGLLGPPTTMRKSDKGDTATLYYALEIDSGSFLAGQVLIADHRVVEVHKPTLK
jgi:hypothetical protein